MKSNKPLFSLIVPIYNVEKYLGECVDSILNQSFGDFELILVDDGSRDNCPQMCDKYAEQDCRIKVIHKQNGGLSDARNAGLKIAIGEFVLFVDADDYIAYDSLLNIEKCVERQSCQIDVMFLEAYKVFVDGSIVSLGDGYKADLINGQNKNTVLEHLSELPKYPGSACTKLIRRKLIIDNSLYFEKGLLSEDIDWTISLLVLAENFAYCDAKYYYYRQGRTGSITNTVGVKNVQALLYIIKKWSSQDMTKMYQKEINAFMAYEFMIAYFNYSKLAADSKLLVKEDLYAYKWILDYAKTKKIKIFRIFNKLFGDMITSRLLNCLKK